jgi:hypothetical protein
VKALAVALVSLLAACMATPTSQTAAPSTASPKPSPSGPATTADPASARLADAAGIISALGYPPPTGGRVSQQPDLDVGGLDTQAQFGGSGWLVVWDPSGQLVSAFRIVSPGAVGVSVARPEVTARMAAVAAVFGRPAPAGGDLVEADDGQWQAEMPRTVDGLPVLGDGTFITLYADGSFLGYHYLYRTLEPRPARVLTEAEAEGAYARAQRDASIPPFIVARANLIWAPPSATPAPTLRLCWVLYLQPVGGAAGASSQVFLDAGTGAVLWGDATA